MRLARIQCMWLVLALALGVGSTVSPAFSQEQGVEETGKKKKKKEGRRKGAVGGAILGLGMGALTGEAKYAAAGAAAGALAGGVAGNWYDYDQSRQDDRTQMLADSIAASKSGDAGGAPPPPAGQTVGDVGKSHMQDFLGEWKIDAWVLGTDGKRITGSGTARGLSAGENATRVLVSNLKAEGYDATVGAQLLLRYEPGQGFFAESSFDMTDETLKYVGEYLVERNAYNFYLVSGEGGEMMQGGMLRSAVRTEIRVTGSAMWVMDVFTHVDGEETLVQSYRFTRS